MRLIYTDAASTNILTCDGIGESRNRTAVAALSYITFDGRHPTRLKAIESAYGLDPRLDFVKVDGWLQELDFGFLVPCIKDEL
jgi:hypothetical protein